MELTSLHALATCARGRLRFVGGGDPSQLVNGIATDSRRVQPGGLYVALRGQNFDGHAFIQGAQANGAIGAVVDEDFANCTRESSSLPNGLALIIVADTLRAYQDIAAWHRQKMVELEVVGITGSNGKTTTKDFVAAVLESRYCVLKTDGNFNNHIGVPHTLLRINNSHDVAIVEMGINHPGEMSPLTRMASPTAAVVTNIGSAHLEFMGSKEATAIEKSALLTCLPEDGLAVVNGDDALLEVLEGRANGVVVTAGFNHGMLTVEKDVQIVDGTAFTARFSDDTKVDAKVRFPGKHVVANALFALAIGRAFNLSNHECAAALANAALTAGRVELKTVNNVSFLDDSYNANPESMVASIDALKQLSVKEDGRRIAVLGSMGELGDDAEAGYRTVGEAAGMAGLDLVVSVGADAAGIDEPARRAGAKNVVNLPTTTAAAEHLTKLAGPGDVVLVKGSRSARMEQVIELFPFHPMAPGSA